MGVYWGNQEIDLLNSLPGYGTGELVLNLDAGLRSSYGGSGSTWNDLAGTAQNATLFNSPSFVTDDAKGGCFSFNGTNQYATVPDVTGVTDLDRQDFSLEFWIKYDSDATTARVFDKRTTDSRIPFSIVFNSSNKFVTLTISDQNSIGGPGGIPLTSGWTHCVFSLDWGSTTYGYYLYQNGSVYGFGSFGNYTQTMANASALYIGRAGDASSYFKGKIAVFRIYTKALTGSEVLANYNAYKGKFGL
jgi:hypothetical protein